MIGVGGRWATTPAGVIRAIRPRAGSVNQTLPSAPATIPPSQSSYSLCTPKGAWNSLTEPVELMRPMRLRFGAVNQTLPSGPPVIVCGPSHVWMPVGNVVTTPCGVIRPIRPRPAVNQTLPSGPAVILAPAARDRAREPGDGARRADPPDPPAAPTR